MSNDDVVVKTSTGLVRGKEMTFENKTIAVFRGIPYGRPPTGSLRFSRPVIVEKWRQTHDAFEFAADCFQFHPNGDKYPQSEDCLYLNIWRPGVADKELLPVFIYIHGGGFVGGDARIPGEIFATFSNSILVSINYRLNIFGFLNLYVKDVPGNMGLLDQQLAMAWVKMNIEAFGGDSSIITIFGESAGGASVGYHLLSPKSKNLFNRAAMHSGSPTDPWAFDSKVDATAKALQLAELTGCNRSDFVLDPQRLVRCFKDIPARQLSEFDDHIKMLKQMTFTFVPTVDWHFILATPQQLLRQGKFKKTDLIIGTDKNDGATFIQHFFKNYLVHGFLTIQEIVEITRNTFSDLTEAQLAAVVLHYFGTSDPYKKLQNTIEAGYLAGDYSFLCPSLDFAEQMSRFGGKAYNYQFVHRKAGSKSWIGVPHAADEVYILGIVQVSDIFTAAEKELSKRMIRQWTSFGATGYVLVDYLIFIRQTKTLLVREVQTRPICLYDVQAMHYMTLLCQLSKGHNIGPIMHLIVSSLDPHCCSSTTFWELLKRNSEGSRVIAYSYILVAV